MDAEQEKTTAQEIAADQRKEHSILKADALLMRALMKHPGWPRYLSMIEASAQTWNNIAREPLGNLLEVGKLEHAKGTLNGLSLAAQLPAAKIRQAIDTVGQSFLDAE